MKRFLEFIKNKKLVIFFILFTTMYEIFATTVSPKIFSKIIDHGIMVKNIDVIKKSGFFMFSISSISLVLNIVGACLITKLGFEFTDHLTKEVFNKVQDFSFENINKFKSTSIITRLTKDTSNVAMFFTGAIRNILIFPFTLAFALFFAFRINAKLTAYALVILPVLAALIIFIGKKMHKMFDKLNKKIDNLNQVVKENITGMKDIKIYTLEEEEIKKFNVLNTDIKRYTDKTVTAIILVMPLIEILIQVILAYILWKGVLEIKAGNLETGSLIALVMYFGQILTAILMIGNTLREFYTSLSSFRRIEEVLATKNIKNTYEEKDIDFSKLDISLENINLKIDEKQILKDINLNIPFGTSLGIIGNTGSSKTTLINIISGVLKPTSGNIKLNNVDIRNIDEKKYIENISYIPQKLVMLSGNIKDNITMKNKNISEENVVSALKISEAYEFVSNYEDGIMHEVEEGGTNFSGGQKQRLNIARGIAKNPKILILDDSTSAIDQTTEKNIWKNIDEKIGKITKIVISQRIASMKKMDKIIVMDKGKITNIGTHDELILKDKIYKEIYNMQK